MAKITREQLKKWNEQAKNGFKLDLEYFLVWNEKTLVKNIKQEDGTIIQFKLWYVPEYETITNEHGCKWNQRTGRNIPMMKIDKLVPGRTEGVYIVNSVKDNMQIGEPEKTLKYSTLCKLSGEIDTDAELEKIA